MSGRGRTQVLVTDLGVGVAVLKARQDDAPMCKYGDDCYQRKLLHIAQYRHERLEKQLPRSSDVDSDGNANSDDVEENNDSVADLGNDGDSDDDTDATVATTRKPFDGFIMSSTGAMATPRTQFELRLSKAGASIAKTLTKTTTHLILGARIATGGQPSSKEEKAKKWGVKVVSEDWVTKELVKYEQSTTTASDGESDDNESESGNDDSVAPAMKPFDGFIMCCTGAMATPRLQFETRMANYGASIAKTVTQATTHLVVGARTATGGASSAKEEKAAKVGAKIVSEQWATDEMNHSDRMASSRSTSSLKRKHDDGASVNQATTKRTKLAQNDANSSNTAASSSNDANAGGFIQGNDSLQDGDTVTVQSATSSSVYRITRNGDSYWCTCKGWMMQSNPVNVRTCKHLRELRGEKAEASRIGYVVASTGGKIKSVSTQADISIQGVMLAKAYEPAKHDIDGWLLSEKLDGMRGYWDGKQLQTRTGKVIHAPSFFTKDLPTGTALDGELFAGRGDFDITVSIARSQCGDENSATAQKWKSLTYCVFDCPNHQGGFEERLKECERLLKRAPYAKVLPHDVCKDKDMLYDRLEKVEAEKGEGVMLRRPGSKYSHTRTTDLLKVKTFIDDEAIVVGEEAGKGKHTGKMGALQCKLRDGTQFKIGSGFTDQQRLHKYVYLKTVVTFRYFEKTKAGVPRFPTFLRIRPPLEVDLSEFPSS